MEVSTRFNAATASSFPAVANVTGHSLERMNADRVLAGGYERDMRRDPLIINLYDKPQHPRRPPARHVEPSSWGTALLCCTAITLATAGFFWGYDALAHRDGLYLPSSARAATTERRPLRAIETPAPDMNSPEVVRANADVPPSAIQKNVAHATEHAPTESNVAAPPKKKVHAAHRISPEARESYAAAPAFSRSTPFGGW